MLAGILLWLLFSSVLSADSLQVLDLEHKPASELIPIIEPLLDEGDAVTGTGYQLILRADKSTLAQIASLLKQIDTRPMNLQITVRNNSQRSSRHHGIDTSGQVVIGDHSRADVNIHATDRRRTDDSDILQKITVLEGGKASIGSGQSVPMRSRQVYRHGHWVTIHDNIELKDIGNTVVVVPRLHGDQVTLTIEPVYSKLEKGRDRIHYQSVDTVVTGKLGEWIPLAVIDEQNQSSGRGILSTDRSSDSEYANIEVKVEIKE